VGVRGGEAVTRVGCCEVAASLAGMAHRKAVFGGGEEGDGPVPL